MEPERTPSPMAPEVPEGAPTYGWAFPGQMPTPKRSARGSEASTSYGQVTQLSETTRAVSRQRTSSERRQEPPGERRRAQTPRIAPPSGRGTPNRRPLAGGTPRFEPRCGPQHASEQICGMI